MGEFYRQEEGGARKLLAKEKKELFQARSIWIQTWLVEVQEGLETNDNQDTLILLLLFMRLERNSKYWLQTISKRHKYKQQLTFLKF